MSDELGVSPAKRAGTPAELGFVRVEVVFALLESGGFLVALGDFETDAADTGETVAASVASLVSRRDEVELVFIALCVSPPTFLDRAYKLRDRISELDDRAPKLEDQDAKLRDRARTLGENAGALSLSDIEAVVALSFLSGRDDGDARSLLELV